MCDEIREGWKELNAEIFAEMETEDVATEATETESSSVSDDVNENPVDDMSTSINISCNLHVP